MLYTMSRDTNLTYNKALLHYYDGVRKSFDLYLFNVLVILKIAEYSKKDAANKTAKLLPTKEDKEFTPRLCDNEIVQSLLNNQDLTIAFKRSKLKENLRDDTIKTLYSEFNKTEVYKEYLKKANPEVVDHRKILLELYKTCAGSEVFNDFMEEKYFSWIDDKSLIVGAIKKSLKSLPNKVDFFEDYRPTEETTKEFGETLLKKVSGENEELLSLIEPTLKNWDADRVAIVDMILLKMALCELMGFPTIPTKVTLNEFVEIAKQYSTDKSKDFINGILDRLMKKLDKEGKINKEGRGLIE